MFYKVKALAATGRPIILHYFQYREGRNAEELRPYCREVHAYQRKSFLRSSPLQLPFIIGSRINRTLVDRLNSDDYPILLEGLHCAGLIPLIQNKKRIVLRMHNEEGSYYRGLAKMEMNPVKKAYFQWESTMLSRYQKGMDKELSLACLSHTDMERLQKEPGFRQLHFIPCFIPWQRVSVLEGKGQYCLYHGNLAVAENEGAATWLIRKVFAPLSIPLVIAGSGVSDRLRKAAATLPTCRLVEHPPMDELNGLIRDAHINILPSLNTTGVKLKLLHALYNGRFCLVNSNGVKGSGLEDLVDIVDEAEAFREKIKALWEQDFNTEMIGKRKSIERLYNNASNASALNALW